MSIRWGCFKKVLVPALLCAACTYTCAAEAPPAQPQYWSVLPLLPDQTLAVVHATDVRKTARKVKQTGLWQIWSDGGVQKALAQPLAQARGFLMAQGMRFGVDFSAVLDLFSDSEITLALLDVEARPGVGDGTQPSLLLCVQARDKGQDLADELSRRVQQLNGAIGEALRLDQQQMDDGTLLHSVVVPAGPTFYYAHCDGAVMVCMSAAPIERLVKAHRKGKTDASLGDNPAFVAALRKAGPEADLLAFLNFQAVLKNPLVAAAPHVDWERHGITSMRGLSYSLALQGRGVHETVFVDAPEAERKGIFGLLAGAPLTPENLASLPRNALFAGVFHFSVDQMLSKFLALLDANPPSRQQFDAQMAALGQALKMDVLRKLNESFTGNLALSVSAAPGRAKLGISFPQVSASVGLKDPAAFAETLKTVVAALPGAVQVSQTPEGDKTITTLHWGAPDNKQFSYILSGREWQLALYPAALRAELQRRAQPQSGSLADDPDFAAAYGALKNAPFGVVYLDVQTLAGTLYDLGLPLLQMQAPKFGVDTFALPPANVISAGLSSMVLGVGADANGLSLESYGPTGVLPLIAGTAAGAALLRRFAEAPVPAPGVQGTAPAVPGVAPAKKPVEPDF